MNNLFDYYINNDIYLNYKLMNLAARIELTVNSKIKYIFY